LVQSPQQRAAAVLLQIISLPEMVVQVVAAVHYQERPKVAEQPRRDLVVVLTARLVIQAQVVVVQVLPDRTKRVELFRHQSGEMESHHQLLARR
jgi:hypothetical protein